MEYIQKACEQLAGHWDCQVSRIALEISDADRRREAEHQSKSVAMEAALSTESAKRKVVEADLRRTKAQNNKFRAMLFGPSSEKTDKDDGKSDEPDSGAEPPKPGKPKPNAGGAAAESP